MEFITSNSIFTIFDSLNKYFLFYSFYFRIITNFISMIEQSRKPEPRIPNNIDG